jgi:preprotein translocase subunit SecF
MEFLKNANYNFVGSRKIAIIISSAAIFIGLISIVFHNGLNLGIDFRGGTIVQIRFEYPVTSAKIRSTLDKIGLGKAEIQKIGEEYEFIIRVPLAKDGTSRAEEIKSVISQTLSDNPYEVRRLENVGPKIGAELRVRAFWAILASMFMILIYISIRFEFKFAVGAIIALFHDVLITLGVFSILNLEITLPVIAAFLTIVGYSLNDTIVNFDRIRENLKSIRNQTYDIIVNTSLNQSLSRTIITSLTTFLVVLVLFIGAGDVIHSFAFALMIGVIVGTYSSIYIASPVLIIWQEKWGKTGKKPTRR